MKLIEYFKSNPGYILLLAVLSLVAVFMCIMAVHSTLKRSKENQEIIEKIKRENALIIKYSALTPSLIESSDKAELLHGVGLRLQRDVSNADDIMKAFNRLSEKEQIIYAVECLCQDYTDNVSEFFRANGEPVTTLCKKFINQSSIVDRAKEIFNELFNTFDDDNESFSFNKERITTLDSEFLSICPPEDIALTAGSELFEF